MIKISFLYGTMKSSKTANMLMTAHNYLEKDIQPILVKPETDNRSGHDTIESRVGIKEKADGGGEVWTNIKYFVLSNKDNPKYKGMNGKEVHEYLENRKKRNGYFK